MVGRTNASGEVLDDYTGVTVDAGAVTSDDSYTYASIPVAGKYDTASKIRIPNSTIASNITWNTQGASGGSVVTKTESITLSTGSYIVNLGSSNGSGSAMTHALSVSGGTYSKLGEYGAEASTSNLHAYGMLTSYIVNVTSSSGTVTGTSTPASTSDALGHMFIIGVLKIG